MIRFILRRSYLHPASGITAPIVSHPTIDIDVPELERMLTAGGFGEDAHDYTELLGAEVLPPDDPEAA